MLCAVIMAGGKGERFWPLSTEDRPKQFLNLLGEESMLQLTVNRLEKIVPMERIFIVTAERYRELIKENVPDIVEKNIICEPEGRNTAPCIALSAFYIEKIYKDCTMLVVPSDHLIIDEDEFCSIVANAESYINKNKEAIVTIGIKPTRPETGYGYIKYLQSTSKIKKVESFEEKPSLKKAEEYLEKGNFLWNSGMFIWKNTTIFELTRRHLPNTYDILNEAALSLDGFESKIKDTYKNVDNISVDYGIMEKTNKIYVIQGNFGWDDLGSWNSLARYKKCDKDNNVIDGSVVLLKCKENIIKTMKKTYIMGAENLIVIETENEIMILNRDYVSKIKELKNHDK